MRDTRDGLTRRQMTALAYVGVLSPLIRRFPRVLAAAAGRTAWLAAPLAALLLCLGLLPARRLLRAQPEGLSGAFRSALGPGPGRALTRLYGLWLTVYAGFLLRSGANRFLSAVYPGAGPGVFVVCMALACALAAAGTLRALGRTSLLLCPLLGAVPPLIFLLTVKDADFSLLLPLTAEELPGDAWAALELANLMTAALPLTLAGAPADGGGKGFFIRDWAVCALWLLLAAALMTVGCLAMFGPALTAAMRYPFFMLARDASVLGSLERFEPVTVTVWVLADFVFVSTLLWLAAKCLVPASARRYGAPALAAAAAAAALLLPADADAFSRLSDRVVPLCSAGFTVALPLLVLLVGVLRRRL